MQCHIDRGRANGTKPEGRGDVTNDRSPAFANEGQSMHQVIKIVPVQQKSFHSVSLAQPGI